MANSRISFVCVCPLARANNSEKAQFLEEIELLKKITGGNNPHVVKMLGCVVTELPFLLITEFLQHGDLLSYLRDIKGMVSAELVQDQRIVMY